jgi:two-component system NtrC family sensor kinase
MKMRFSIQKKLSNISIGIRLAILSAVILLLTIAIFVFISITTQRQNAIKLIHSNTTNLGQSFERILRFSMQEYHREEIENAIKGLTKTENIKTVFLSNHGGSIKYSTSDSLVDFNLTINHRTCSGCHLSNNNVLERINANKQFIYDGELEQTWTIIPVYNSKSCSEASCHIHSSDEQVLGVIEINASTSNIESTLQRSHIRLMLYSLAIAVVVFFILRHAYQTLINKPVRELLKGTKLVAQGNLDHVISKGEAELGELADAFNNMQKKLKEIHQQLIITEKLSSIGKLSAGVAHEINNPLTGILAFTESLLKETNNDDPRKKDYEIIQRETLRCRTIVKNLLDFTRQKVPELKTENINKTIQQTIEIIKCQAKFSKINIILELNELLFNVLIDADQINQILLNLFINAAEAMPDGGTITIRTRFLEKRNMVEIAVSDTGKGIQKQFLDKIFEPFFTTKGGKTNGLGLSISMEIIRNHNGEFKVKSKLGEGTTFFIYLPKIT